MKVKYIVVLLILICSTIYKAQWEKISDLNIGVTGQITVNESNVFFYGSQQGFKLYRFDENGENLTDLSSTVSDEFSHIYEFDGKLYACWLSSIYLSEDNGESWSEISTVSVTGNGALLRFTSDSEILYGVSNRKSIFKSIDKGSTWQEIIINDPNNFALVSVGAMQDIFIAVIIGSGAWISKDAGQTWTINNPSASVAITNVYRYDDKILGQSFNGIYTYDSASDTWIPSSSGLPDDGSLYISRSLTNYGGSLYLGGAALIGSQSSVFTSSNGGVSWNAVSMEGIATLNGAGSTSFVAGNSKNIFCFYYGLFDSENTGFYKTPIIPVTSIDKLEDLPKEFNLSQNYPNPFNPNTTINYQIPLESKVQLKVYDILGHEILTLVNESQTAGIYEVWFDASNLSSGTYFYTLTNGSNKISKKMILIK